MTILIRKVIKKMLLLGIILIEVYAILFMHFFFTMSWYLPDNPIEWTIWSNLEVISEYLIIAIMVFVILLCLASLIISNVIISKSIWILLSSVGIIVACIQGYNFVTFDIPYFAKLGYTHSILFMLLFPHTIAITSCILLSCVWVNSRFQVIDLKMIEIKKNKYAHKVSDTLHVKGKGHEVRIGPNGKPLKGEKELSTQQKQIVDENKKEIRREINKVGKENKRIEENE